jgi:hypothetical protein
LPKRCEKSLKRYQKTPIFAKKASIFANFCKKVLNFFEKAVHFRSFFAVFRGPAPCFLLKNEGSPFYTGFRVLLYIVCYRPVWLNFGSGLFCEIQVGAEGAFLALAGRIFRPCGYNFMSL